MAEGFNGMIAFSYNYIDCQGFEKQIDIICKGVLKWLPNVRFWGESGH
jgi:hypothetical protein